MEKHMDNIVVSLQLEKDDSDSETADEHLLGREKRCKKLKILSISYHEISDHETVCCLFLAI